MKACKGEVNNHEVDHGCLSILMDALAYPIFYQYKNGTYACCNATFADQIAGLAMDDIVGKSPADLKAHLPAGLADTSVENELDALEKHAYLCHEIILSSIDGGSKHYAVHKTPHIDDQGQVLGIVGMMQDITAAKKSEQELLQYRDRLEEMVSQRSAELIAANTRLSQEIEERRQAQAECKFNQDRYHRILENTGTATILIEPDMTISMANAKAEKLAGLAREQFVGRVNALDFVAPAYREQLKLYHELRLQGDVDVPPRFEFQSQNARGQVRDILASVKFIPETRQVVASMLDITRSNQMHKERRRLAAVIDQSTDAILITDTHGRVEYVNHAFEQLSGYDRQACLGQDMEAPFFSEQDRAVLKQMTFTISAEDNWSGRMENKNREGRRYITDTHIFPICDPKGHAVNLVCIKRDVTHEAQIEKQLQQAQKMEAIGTLAGGIAHDFNNILGGILGYTEICRMKAGPEGPLQRYLDRILSGCQRAKELVANILAFSRKQNEEAKPIEIQMIVKEAMKLLRASIPSTVEFKQQIDTQSGIVLATPTQIHQIIMNLCTNAAQAMQETGGQLNVALKVVRLGLNECKDKSHLRPGPHVRLTVSDTGPGMSAGVLNRIFEPYFTTKSKTGGTGLGLSVVHSIVKNIEGHLSVTSESGKGTTFVVHIPCVEEQASVATPTQEEIPKGDETILVVDDELFILEIMSDMLQEAGYKVETTNSSAEALQLFRNDPKRFDLIIADHTMPKITGKMLAKEIRALGATLPIILTTGLNPDDNRVDDTLIDFAAILRKPILYKDLAETVRNVLDRGKP